MSENEIKQLYIKQLIQFFNRKKMYQKEKLDFTDEVIAEEIGLFEFLTMEEINHLVEKHMVYLFSGKTGKQFLNYALKFYKKGER